MCNVYVSSHRLVKCCSQRDWLRKNNLEKRIKYRQDQIQLQLLSPEQKLLIDVSAESGSVDNYVWVDSTTLSRFFSCNDGMKDIFESASESELISDKSFLCEHSKGMHPRIACSGKLLPKETYEKFENILRGEYELYMQHEKNGSPPSLSERNISGPFSFLGEKMICEG